MRALPGRQARSRATVPAHVTRASARHDQVARILRALAELVASKGYTATSAVEIAERAHVSHTTFSRHFSGKEEAYLALHDTVVGFSEAQIAERLDRRRTPWADQVIVVLRTLTEQAIADPILARAVIVDALAVGPAMIERQEKALRAYEPLLAAGRQLSPVGRELPATLEATVSGSVAWLLYERLLIGEAERLAEALPAMIALALGRYLGQERAAHLARAELDRELNPG